MVRLDGVTNLNHGTLTRNQNREREPGTRTCNLEPGTRDLRSL